MTLIVATHRMTSTLTEATATRGEDGRWTVTGRDGTYDLNQAITAMTIAQLLATGGDPDLIRDLESELEN